MSRQPESPDVLMHGSWQSDNGVLRWVPAEYAPPIRRKVDVSLLIACPVCQARVGNACKTPCGTSTNPHEQRLVARRCQCGERLGPRQRYCPPCRRQARLETFKSYDARRGPRVRRKAA